MEKYWIWNSRNQTEQQNFSVLLRSWWFSEIFSCSQRPNLTLLAPSSSRKKLLRDFWFMSLRRPQRVGVVRERNKVFNETFVSCLWEGVWDTQETELEISAAAAANSSGTELSEKRVVTSQRVKWMGKLKHKQCERKKNFSDLFSCLFYDVF